MLIKLIDSSITDHSKKKQANTNITTLLFSFAAFNREYPRKKRIPANTNAPNVTKKRCME